MKVFVTGLCLSRNLGGPAMGITLIRFLQRTNPGIEFLFAVPAAQFDVEKEWADRYGIKVVKRYLPLTLLIEKLHIKDLLALAGKMKHKNQGPGYWQTIHDNYMAAMQDCDLVIDMSGISYIGDSAYTFLNGLKSFADFRYAKKLGKPFARFIQTFGPFNHAEVRFFAKKEFKELDFIPARGRKSADMCRQLTNNPGKVYDFPDIAICLETASKDEIRKYLEPRGFYNTNYLIVSPSSVIYNLPASAGGCNGSSYLKALATVIENYLLSNTSNKVLLLPHMYSYIARESDRDKCEKLLELFTDAELKKRIGIVTEDINPMEAKAIIAGADAAIVSRYHALVAALSTGTPAIAIGWNVKYEDLLEYYDMGDYSIDSRNHNIDSLATEVTRLLQQIDLVNDRNNLLHLQKVNVARVEKAFSLLQAWIDKHKPA